MEIWSLISEVNSGIAFVVLTILKTRESAILQFYVDIFAIFKVYFKVIFVVNLFFRRCHLKRRKSVKIQIFKTFSQGFIFISALIFGAAYALPIVTSFRYEFRQTKGLSAEDILKLEGQGIIRKNPDHLTLEQLHEEYKDQYNLEEYENLRIPKPWDEEETKLDKLRSQNKKIKSVKEIRKLPDPEWGKFWC